MKDLPNVSTWRLEWDSNLVPTGRKASNLSISHHAPPSLHTRSSYLIMGPEFVGDLFTAQRRSVAVDDPEVGRRTGLRPDLALEVNVDFAWVGLRRAAGEFRRI